jgi:glycerol-3-phosphate dehydrogenase
MTGESDGRIAFVIPRPDFGAGVVIVGTTDGPAPAEPERVEVEPADVNYLMGLLHRYFPELKLQVSDILSAYVGVRPLMGAQAGLPQTGTVGSEGQPGGSRDRAVSLQKVSREHHIGPGPGGTTLVAGGKYTTARAMAEEIVDHALMYWRRDHREGRADALPDRALLVRRGPRRSTREPINPAATPPALRLARARAGAGARAEGGAVAPSAGAVPEALYDRYGAEAATVRQLDEEARRALPGAPGDPEGFPCLLGQFRFALRQGMALHLEDFYLRRVPLFASRADRGLPWAETLARLWATERNLTAGDAARELESLRAELDRRSAWKGRL